jgi:transcriptional regulator GlxA family with amidase domain
VAADRRRLAAEGTTFEALRDTVRFAMAREFLEMTGLPVGEIGLAVGFASPGVFTEAFRLRNGASPLEWRSARREAPARDP